MKNTILGQVTLDGVVQVYIDGVPLTPTRSLRIYRHSPDGFQWGYAGSGPAQLALAILLEFTEKDIAIRHYQAFKFAKIATQRSQEWLRIDLDVLHWIKLRECERNEHDTNERKKHYA